MDAFVTPAAAQARRDDSRFPATPRAITLAILAMGGEGGGVLADWVVDTAEHGGYVVQLTSVPGVAQRTGATIYYLELFSEAAVKAAARDPVLSLMPTPGEVDIVVASELMEAGRAIQRGLVTADRTTFIVSSHRVFSMTEKTAMGDGRVDAAALIEAGRIAAKTFVHGDFARIAEETGSVISAPLLGALAAAGGLPFARAAFEEAIRRGGIGVAASLAAFEQGLHAAADSMAETAGAISPSPPAARVGPSLLPLAARIGREFPPGVGEVLVHGIRRLADYQDEAYAAAYLDRLADLRALEARHGAGDCAVLREAARYLALWMSYEDTIRVADLKTRPSRFDRVRRDVRSEAEQVLEIKEFLHPRVEEIADTLPAGLGRWLLRRPAARRVVERLTEQGWAVETTSLRGFLMLYAIAGMRRWRRRTLRFAREQQRIAVWLGQVAALVPEDYALAREVAECPRLIKGYGDTHARGWRNFATLMEVIPRLRTIGGAAPRMRALRAAALADESGGALQAALRDLER